MARSTAQTVGAKQDRCATVGCHVKAEVTVTNGKITLRVCTICGESHAFYAAKRGLTITPDAASNIALCDGCRRFIGHNGRAAHRCH